MSLPGMDRTSRIGLYLIAAAFCLYSAVYILRTSVTVADARYFCLFDDAMISMRYAKNIAEGYGAVWNPGGERVEGFTNPLWTLFMAGVHLLPISESKVSLAVQIVGFLLLLGTLYQVCRIGLKLGRNRVPTTLLATAMTGFYYPLVTWSLQGMEVSALAFLVCWAIVSATEALEGRRNDLLLAGISVLAILIRQDAVLPFSVIYGYLIWRDPPYRFSHFRTGALAIGLPIVALQAFRLFYYGEWLPNTYYLKLGGFWPAIRFSYGILTAHNFIVSSVGTWTLLGLAAVFLCRKPAMQLCAGIFTIQMAYHIYVGGDAWEALGLTSRFITVGVPGLFVMISYGLSAASDALFPKRRALIIGLALIRQ